MTLREQMEAALDARPGAKRDGRHVARALALADQYDRGEVGWDQIVDALKREAIELDVLETVLALNESEIRLADVLESIPKPASGIEPAQWYAQFLREAADQNLRDAVIFAVLATDAGGVFGDRLSTEDEFLDAVDGFETACANGAVASKLIAMAYTAVWQPQSKPSSPSVPPALQVAAALGDMLLEANDAATMRYVYIDADGELSVRRSDGEIPLDTLRALVGGNIEGIYGDGLVFVYDNEDGLALNLKPTVRFPKVNSLGGVLRGPVVIVGDDGHGNQRDLTHLELTGIYLTRTDDDYPTLHIVPVSITPGPTDFGFGLKLDLYNRKREDDDR